MRLIFNHDDDADGMHNHSVKLLEASHVGTTPAANLSQIPKGGSKEKLIVKNVTSENYGTRVAVVLEVSKEDLLK